MDLPPNFGKPWSETDLRDIYQYLAEARSVSESAWALGRSEGEVVRKVREVAATMFMEGFMTKDAVANATGLTLDQVDSAIKEYDIMHRRSQETMRPHVGEVAQSAPASSGGSDENIRKVVMSPHGPKATDGNPLVHLAATISKSLKEITRALDRYIENSN